MKTGIELITEERQRQLTVTPWSLEHDKQHQFGELAKVAATLAVVHTDAHIEDADDFIQNGRDPWGLCDKHGAIQRLVIAGALIAAEIDRIQSK